MTAGPGVTTEELLAEVIGVLAGACQDADSRTLCRSRRGLAMKRRISDGERMRLLAGRVARCAAAGDYAGLDRMLGAPRPVADWRRLVILLAAAADLERLETSAERTAA